MIAQMMQKEQFFVACFASTLLFAFSGLVSFLFLQQCNGSTTCLHEAIKLFMELLIILVCSHLLTAALILRTFHFFVKGAPEITSDAHIISISSEVDVSSSLQSRTFQYARSRDDTLTIPHSNQAVNVVEDVTTESLYSGYLTDFDDHELSSSRFSNFSGNLSDTPSIPHATRTISAAEDVTTASLYSGYTGFDDDGLSLNSE